MAKLDFPDASYSPWIAPNNVIYTYIGTSPNGFWEANTASASSNLTAIFVERAGSTMTGALKLDNAGNVSLPDISFDTDVNTGIYSPGADSLAITTGGTQRVTVDSSGMVGVGVSAPSNALDIGSGNIEIGGGNNTALTWSSDVSSHYLKFTSAINGLTLNGYGGLAFETNGANERMRIDASGNVFIGGTTASSADIALNANGSATFVGTVTANAFSGDGSALTNLPSGYTNSDVDSHLNTSTAASNEVLSWNGSDYDWVAQSGGGGGAGDINGLSDAVTYDSGVSIGLGTGALVSDDGSDNNNTAVGYQALNATTSGAGNVGAGYQVLKTNTTGSKNVAAGNQALLSCTSGSQNVAFGDGSLYSLTTASYCFASGEAAGQSITTGSGNVFLGRLAGRNVTASSNNLFIGTQAGSGVSGAFSNNNVAIGANALGAFLTNGLNTAVGSDALLNSTGQSNTGIGYGAGNTTTSGGNITCIGYDAEASSATVSNEITLGNSSVSSLRCNVQTISSLSDARDKTNVQGLPEGLAFIQSLNPVKFQWQTRDGNEKDGTYEAGFIAQDLQYVQQQRNADYLGLVMDENPERLEASYGKLIPSLVKAIQELKSEVEQLKGDANN